MISELYKFTAGTDIWRYTSGPIPVSITETEGDGLAHDYLPQPLSRSDVQYSPEGIGDIDLSVPYNVEPFYAMRILNLTAALSVMIWEYDGTTRTVVFNGRVAGKTFSAGLLTSVKVVSLHSLLNRRYPQNTFTAMCRHGFGPLTPCGLTPLSESFTVVDPDTMTLPQSINIFVIATSAITFACGTLVGGSLSINGATPLTIISSSDFGATFIVQTLFMPSNPVIADDVLTLTQGCDLRIATCAAYDNLANNGSFPYLPQKDL